MTRRGTATGTTRFDSEFVLFDPTFISEAIIATPAIPDGLIQVKSRIRDRLRAVFCLALCGSVHIPVSVSELQTHSETTEMGRAMKRRHPARRKITPVGRHRTPLYIRYAELLQLRQMVLNTVSAKPPMHRVSK
jgi:hypothetical protein